MATEKILVVDDDANICDLLRLYFTNEGYVLMGTLAAFGLLCAMWALAGWLLPGDRNGVAVFFCGKGDNRLPPLPRWRLLRQLGLLRCRMAVVAPELDAVEKEIEKIKETE